MGLFKKNSIKRYTTIYLVVFLVLVSAVGVFSPTPAHAQWLTTTLGDIPRTIGDIITKIVNQAKAVAWKNALKAFLGKIAYDTATQIATGEHGAKALFERRTWDRMLTDARDEAVGEALTSLFSGQGYCSGSAGADKAVKTCKADKDCPFKPGMTESYLQLGLKSCDDVYKMDLPLAGDDPDLNLALKEELQACKDAMYAEAHEKCEGVWSGFDVCEPHGVDAMLKVQFMVGIGRELQYKKPRCDWKRIKESQGQTWKNMQTFFSSLDKWDAYKHTLKGMFKAQQSDFGIWMRVQSDIKDLQQQKALVAQKGREEGRGFKSITSLITGQTKTPVPLVEKTAEMPLEQATKAETTFTGELVADTINIFTNTLVSKLLKKWLSTGIVPDTPERSQYSHGFGFGGDLIAAADIYNLEFLKPDYSVGGAQQILNELVSCPTGGPQSPIRPNNCVIDENFRIAVEQKMTIGEAIKAGRINGEMVIGFYDDGGGGSATLAEDRNILSYRSLLILRKYRILPVGLGLAAEYIRDFIDKEGGGDLGLGDREHGGVTLNTLIDNYSNPSSPFYHLVDPNWILKAPEVFVKRQGPGEQLDYTKEVPFSEVGPDGKTITGTRTMISRADYAADEQSCIYEHPDGSCAHWGYCVEEKPSWKFGLEAESCRAKYKSCQVFKHDMNMSQAAYIYDTVDKNGCNMDNDGCRAYCEDWDVVNDVWTCTFDLASDEWGYVGSVAYYDREAAVCGEGQDGCHHFLQPTQIGGGLLTQTEWDELISGGSITSGAYTNNYLVNAMYLGLAPDYYNCEGFTRVVGADRTACPDPNTPETGDPYWREDVGLCVESGTDECADYVLHCEEDDINCKFYTPTASGDPAVPGVIEHRVCEAGGPNYSRQCDESEVELWNDECPEVCAGYDVFYKPETTFEQAESDLAFIPLMGRQCTQIGCDEFTNMDKVAKGGEGIEYYSYLRVCVKPDPNDPSQQTYYTWEGSDTTGYQLKRWELVSSGGVPVGEDCSSPDELLDPDCREFFVIGGGNTISSYHRLFKTTITVSEDCYPYRRTIADQVDCVATNGVWDNGQCIYMAMPEQGIGCSAANAGCREYKSPGSYNYEIVLSDDFEDGDSLGWDDGSGSADDPNVPQISGEAVKRDDHSMYVAGQVLINLAPGSLERGKNYKLVLVAKGDGAGSVRAEFESAGGNIPFESTGVLEDWFKYELNLVDVTGIDRDQGDDEVLRLWGNFYLDEIILKEVDSDLLIKNSWTTPPICGGVGMMTPDSLHEDIWDGTALDNINKIGCEEYEDSQGGLWYVWRFSGLCPEELVGCEALIDTQNTASLADDGVVYLVNQTAKVCSVDGDVKGCQRLGQMQVSYDVESNSNQGEILDVYKVIDPDNFSIDCQGATDSDEYVNCDKYVANDRAYDMRYFKNPMNRVCEWRTNGYYEAIYNGQSGLGADNLSTTTWFLIDEDVVCPESDFCDLTNTDNFDDCLVKSCPSIESGCQEYIDPRQPEGCVDVATLNMDKCDHYYYKKVDTGDCDINPLEGCVGFYNSVLGEPTMFSDCQPGCPFVDETTYYNEDCRIVTDPSRGKPGCVGQEVGQINP